MNGDLNLVWVCLIGGMLLQLTYMILPLERWDWARYLGAAALPLIQIAWMNNNRAPSDAQGLLLCGVFTFMFALIFQQRLLPRLGEGLILMWTAVLLCVIVELGAWHSAATYLGLCMGTVVLLLLIMPITLSYVLKLAIYALFLVAVVAMGALQFRGSDFSLVAAGRTDEIDFRFALIDGVAAAYIGVHVVFLYELLPIPGKGERWDKFKARWKGYLNLIVSRFDVQRLDTRAAVGLVMGVALLAYVNHELGFMPDRSLAYLVLFGVPIAWRAVLSRIERQPHDSLAAATPNQPVPAESARPEGIGRLRHSRKHRQ
jgi:hypothetical protein